MPKANRHTNRRITIKDVAEAAGVSVGSVSNVINGSPKASDDLRERVLSTAKELGFEANKAAQILRTQRSGVIGLCTTSVVTDYLRGLADALDMIVTRNGFELLQVFTRQETDQELVRVRSLLQRQTDGIIFLPSVDPHRSLDALYASRRPTVVIDRLYDDDRFDYVVPDNESAMRELVSLFAARGHRRLVFVPQNLQVVTTRHRIRGLETAARVHDPQIVTEIIQKPQDEVLLQRKLVELVFGDFQATGIIAGNSRVAFSTIQACSRAGIKIPENVSLATFDDPDWAQLLPTPLTTVRIPVDTIAEESWRLMQAQLDNAAAPHRMRQHERIQVTAQIIERNSMNSAGKG